MTVALELEGTADADNTGTDDGKITGLGNVGHGDFQGRKVREDATRLISGALQSGHQTHARRRLAAKDVAFQERAGQRQALGDGRQIGSTAGQESGQRQ
jgi:hypothetical protein